MATSKAKKMRLKLVREGRLNPENSRGGNYDIDLRTKRTKTKVDIAKQQETKHKKRNFDKHNEDNASFFCFYIFFYKKISFYDIYMYGLYFEKKGA